MRRYKNILLIVFSFSCLAAWSQNNPLVLGSKAEGLGINFCSYSSTSNNLCTLTKITGSLPGTSVNAFFSYAVLYKLMIAGMFDYTAYTGGVGSFDFVVGGEYYIPYTKFKKPPIDLYLSFNGGYSHLNVESTIVSANGIFNASGVKVGFGAGARKYFRNNFGIFLDANYVIHHYSGGEVAVSDGGKNPYSLTLSGFNYGFGVCRRIGTKLHPLID